MLKIWMAMSLKPRLKTWEQSFGYTLPKDKFRQPYIARQVRVTIPVHLAPLSWASFQLVEGQVDHRDGIYQNGVIDTPFVTVSVV